MSATSLLARLGLRLGTLGTGANLAFCAPVAEGDVSMNGHTAATRTGFYFPTNNTMGVVANGVESHRVWPSGSVQFGGLYSADPNVPVLVSTNAAAAPAPLADTMIQIVGVDGSASDTRILIDSFSATSNNSITGRRSRGTSAAPTALQSGDTILSLNAFGYGATSYGAGGRARVLLAAAQNWTDAAQGTQVNLQITPNNTIVPYTAAMLNQDGSLTLQNQTALTNGLQFVPNGGAGNFVGQFTTTVLTATRTYTFPDASVSITGGTITAGQVAYGSATANVITGNAGFTYATTTGLSITQGNSLVFTATAASAGTISTLTVTAAANTGQNGTVEVNGINLNMAATRTWAAGAITTQREVLIQAPTYAFATASTIATAATVAITGAPVAGLNATLTNAYALWVQAGQTDFDGLVTHTAAAIIANNNSIGTVPLTVTQSVATSGSVGALVVTTGASTGQAGTVEVNGVKLNCSATRTWIGGTLATQREVYIQAPTYAFSSPSTIGSAATFAISGPPIAGTNATITNNYAFWVQSGTIQFDGFVTKTAGALIANNNNVNVVPLTVTQSAATSGTVGALIVTTGASTGQTATSEVSGIRFNLTATRTWATGAISTQREFYIQAPTYAFVGASTVTTAATVAINGAPVAGTNATITNAYAFWVQAGNALFAANTTVNGVMLVANSATVNSIPLTVTQSAATSGTVGALLLATGASTGQTASTEVNGVQFNLTAIRTWATGALATQREFYIRGPTYAFVGTSTITTAATVAINGAPAAGTNATITNAYAFWVQAGNTLLATNTTINGVLLVANSGTVNTVPLTVTQSVATSGSVGAFVVTSGASTGQTASAEVNGVLFNLSATRTWATGAITTQREFYIQAPTYAFAGASTITTAYTVYISGAPSAGTNATITTAYAFFVNAGGSRFNGSLFVGGGLVDANVVATSWSAAGSSTIAAGVLTTLNSNTGTIASYTLTMPAAPSQGQYIKIASAGIVSTFTLSPNAGQTIQSAPTAIVANTSFEFVYSGTIWYRLL